MVDSVTKRWIWNASDERAARNGCKFDEERGHHFVDICAKKFRLWEGEYAGEPFLCVDWQYACLMRVFGWIKYSPMYDRWVRRFTRASVWVPKKNKKSPTGAAVGLYLMAYDGEPGQHVFSGAKDGRQALIVHRHALAMVQSSDELSADCTINKSTSKILHRPTGSTYEILAGDNIASQEGLNGSVIIDETHVVDRRLALVLEDMGASRSEPLQFEISTAGNDPQSYGRVQYEFGKQVEADTVEAEHFFFKSYEAPQDATDEQLNNEDVWRDANPAWYDATGAIGQTINPDEFRAAYKKANRSLTDWAAFKQRRLNIWQQSANPWIRLSDWQECATPDVTLDELEGLPCVMGLDLSKTRDMTAAVFVFCHDDGESFTQYARFWLPEQAARDKADKASYMQWARDDELTLTKRRAVDMKMVGDELVELMNRFNVSFFSYDPTYADEIAERLADETQAVANEFTQTSANYAAPTEEYESLIINTRLHHLDQPVLNWQAGHVMVKEINGRKRPVKFNKDDYRTIDGIVAGVMGVYSTPHVGGNISIYETPGQLAL